MFISRKRLKEAQEQSEKLIQEIEKIKDKAFLVGIERKGRSNVFTFIRGEKLVQIETMGLLSDNVPEWRKQLIEK